jgi:hypothetical protein
LAPKNKQVDEANPAEGGNWSWPKPI